MTIEDYQKLFKITPPAHLVRDGQVWCPRCGKEPPQIKVIYGVTGIYNCLTCQKQQKPSGFSTPSARQKMENLSPEEVMSGVHAGGVNEFGFNSKETYSQEHQRTVKELKEALS